MGTVASLLIKINGDISGLKSALSNASDAVRQTGEKMQSVGVKLTAGVTTPLLGIGAAAIKAAADQEQLQIAFSTMLGSAEKATEMIKSLNEFAAKTPFETAEVQKAAKMLIGYGVAAEDVTSTLRQLGDIAAGLNIPLGDLAYLFGTARVQGRLFAADINQFSNRGVPIIEALAETMGVAQGSIKKLVEEGKVGFPELQAALNYLTEEGSQFGGLMEAQSASINGMLSTLKDNVALALAEIGKTIIEQFDLKTKLASALEWTTQMKDALLDLAATNPQLFRLGIVIAGVAATAGPALLALGTAVTLAGTAIGGLGAAIGFLLSPIGLLLAGVTALGAAWYFNFGGIQEITAGVVSEVQSTLEALGNYFMAVAEDGDYLNDWLTHLPEVVQRPVLEIGKLAAELRDNLPSAIATGQAELTNLLSAVQSVAGKVSEFLSPSFERAKKALSGVGEKISRIAPHFVELGTAIQNLVTTVMPLIGKLAGMIGVVLVAAAATGTNLFAAAIQNMENLVVPIIEQITDTINLITSTIQNVVAFVAAVAAGDWAGAWEAVKKIVIDFDEYFQSTFTNMSSFLSGVFNTIKQTVLNTLRDLNVDAQSKLEEIKGWWEKAWSSLTSAFEPVKSGVMSITAAIDELKRGIESFKNWIGSINIPNPFAGLEMPSLPSFPNPFGGNQLGTAYAHGGWSWVGENRRPELVYLPRGAQVIPWQQAKDIAPGGVTINIQSATIRSEQDLWELAYAIDEIRRRRR